VDFLWAMKSEGVRLIVCVMSFQDFQTCDAESTNVTDRQTDGLTDECDGKTVLCTCIARFIGRVFTSVCFDTGIVN